MGCWVEIVWESFDLCFTSRNNILWYLVVNFFAGSFLECNHIMGVIGPNRLYLMSNCMLFKYCRNMITFTQNRIALS